MERSIYVVQWAALPHLPGCEQWPRRNAAVLIVEGEKGLLYAVDTADEATRVLEDPKAYGPLCAVSVEDDGRGRIAVAGRYPDPPAIWIAGYIRGAELLEVLKRIMDMPDDEITVLAAVMWGSDLDVREALDRLGRYDLWWYPDMTLRDATPCIVDEDPTASGVPVGVDPEEIDYDEVARELEEIGEYIETPYGVYRLG